jgi:AcrR family transcriptional regulator
MPGSQRIPRRREPQQRRSQDIVVAILDAARRLLQGEGASAVTTNHIAELAGVSIGSLYRYFPNKEAIVAALYERETQRDVAEIRAAPSWGLEERPLREAIAAIVDYQLERHRRLLALGKDLYRAHQDASSLTPHMGTEHVVARMRELLERHGALLRVRDVEHAAFLLARGGSALVRRALDERPEALADPAFREELVDLLFLYLTAPR